MTALRRFADDRRPGSLANRMRQRRFALFERLLATQPEPRRILDVGGTAGFWESRGFAGRPGTEIVLLNIVAFPTDHANITSVVGDAAHMPMFADGEFEVVFSNSVIEHLETRERQRQMASEIRRVGRRYFVQTPNHWFPIEPHFLFPGFQFLPVRARVELLRRFGLGQYEKIPDRAAAERAVRLIRLMTEKELRADFPGGRVWREKFLGWTKSMVIYGGWETAGATAATAETATGTAPTHEAVAGTGQ